MSFHENLKKYSSNIVLTSEMIGMIEESRLPEERRGGGGAGSST